MKRLLFSLLCSVSPCVALAATQMQIDVTSLGMAPGGRDNSSYLKALLAANGPTTVSYAYPGFSAFFPSAVSQGQGTTEYYFSQSLDWSRGGQINCAGAGPFQSTSLVFAPGVDGVIFEDSNTSTDGGGAYGADLKGCAVISLGYGMATGTTGSASITNVNMPSYGAIPATTWAAGDGIIAVSATNGFAPATGFPTVNPGAYIASVNGSTLTLASPYAVGQLSLSNQMAIYRLPAALMYSVTTTSGSNTFTVTAGPSTKLEPGDAIWSDAFPFGSVVSGVSGSAGAQTVTVTDVFGSENPQNATVTHTSGSGRLWKIPTGMARRADSSTHGNIFQGWPVGLKMACSAGYTPGLGCTQSYDEGNTFQEDLIGRWTGGDNTGASTSHANLYGHNYIADILEGGTVGSLYNGDNTNSSEGGQAKYGIVGNCISENYSEFNGMYASNGNGHNYCLPTSGGIGILGDTVAGAGPLFIAPQDGAPLDSTIINSGSMEGQWQFSGVSSSNIVTSAATTSGTVLTFSSVPSWVYKGLNITDNTHSGVIPSGTTVSAVTPTTITLSKAVTGSGVASGDTIVLSAGGSPCVGFDGGFQPFNMWFDKQCGSSTAWYLGFNGYYGAWALGADGGAIPQMVFNNWDASGYLTDGWGGVEFPRGLLLSNSSNSLGQERLVDSGGVAPTDTWRLRGDVRLNALAAPGGTIGWVDTAQGNNFRPFGPVANDVNGQDWTLPRVRSGSASNADITGRIALSSGSATYTLKGKYISAPNCIAQDVTNAANVASVSESATTLTFYGTGNDTVKWVCVGRN